MLTKVYLYKCSLYRLTILLHLIGIGWKVRCYSGRQVSGGVQPDLTHQSRRTWLGTRRVQLEQYPRWVTCLLPLSAPQVPRDILDRLDHLDHITVGLLAGPNLQPVGWMPLPSTPSRKYLLDRGFRCRCRCSCRNRGRWCGYRGSVCGTTTFFSTVFCI